MSGILSIFVLPAAGQDATGRIIGVVTDPSGSVIPKAKITVTNVATGLSNDATATDDGSYQVLLLPIGSYRVNVNLTLGKVTELRRESMKLDIRADFFNILNHAEFRDPTTTITSSTFGTISATGILGDSQPRVIQLAARFIFD